MTRSDSRSRGHLAGTIVAIVTIFGAETSIAQKDHAPILLKGATIIDGLSDTPIEDRSILIENNVIRDLVPSDAPARSGAEVIDLEGKYVIPGLIDSHVHWLGWMGELFLNHGVTAAVVLTEIDAEMRARSKTRSARLPRLFHSAGRPPFGNDDTPAEIRRIVRAWLAKEPDMAHFPTYNEASQRAYAIAAAEARDAGYLVFGHTENAEESIPDGHDVIEHVWGFVQAAMSAEELHAFQWGEHVTWATLMTGRWARIDAMIEDAVARGVYLNPTVLYEWGGMSADAGRRELHEYRTASDPDLVYYPDYTIAGGDIKESLLAKHRQIKNFSRRYGNLPWVQKLPAEDRALFQEGYRNVLEFIDRFVEAGGRVQAGTDTVSGGMPGLVLHQEMQMLVEAGLSPMEALKSATSWSAELLEGIDGALGPSGIGSIAPGNRADLVVLGADPLSNIWNTLEIERVMKDGGWVELGYSPEYYSFTAPSRSIAGATFAPVISTVTPAILEAGHPGTRIVLRGSGFQMTSLIRVDGIAVKTDFVSPRRLEFDLPASAVSSPEPNPYSAPGPYQDSGVVGYRSLEINAFSPPPEGGLSNSVTLLVRPAWVDED